MESKADKSGCSEFSKCMEILELMLDNEATDEQQRFVIDHIDNCIFCFEQYQVETHIRELIKTKVANLPVPEGLANEIRAKIQFGQR
jgi:anti-sigma factor (TIGR02949 family)